MSTDDEEVQVLDNVTALLRLDDMRVSCIERGGIGILKLERTQNPVMARRKAIVIMERPAADSQ